MENTQKTMIRIIKTKITWKRKMKMRKLLRKMSMMKKTNRIKPRHKTTKNRQKMITSIKRVDKKLRKSTKAVSTSKTSTKKELRETMMSSTS